MNTLSTSIATIPNAPEWNGGTSSLARGAKFIGRSFVRGTVLSTALLETVAFFAFGVLTRGLAICISGNLREELQMMSTDFLQSARAVLPEVISTFSSVEKNTSAVSVAENQTPMFTCRYEMMAIGIIAVSIAIYSYKNFFQRTEVSITSNVADATRVITAMAVLIYTRFFLIQNQPAKPVQNQHKASINIQEETAKPVQNQPAKPVQNQHKASISIQEENALYNFFIELRPGRYNASPYTGVILTYVSDPNIQTTPIGLAIKAFHNAWINQWGTPKTSADIQRAAANINYLNLHWYLMNIALANVLHDKSRVLTDAEKRILNRILPTFSILWKEDPRMSFCEFMLVEGNQSGDYPHLDQLRGHSIVK